MPFVISVDCVFAPQMNSFFKMLIDGVASVHALWKSKVIYKKKNLPWNFKNSQYAYQRYEKMGSFVKKVC